MKKRKKKHNEKIKVFKIKPDNIEAQTFETNMEEHDQPRIRNWNQGSRIKQRFGREDVLNSTEWRW